MRREANIGEEMLVTMKVIVPPQDLHRSEVSARTRNIEGQSTDTFIDVKH